MKATIFHATQKVTSLCEITVSIDNAYGEVITEKSLNITSNEWTEYSFTLTSPVDDFFGSACSHIKARM